MKSIKRTLFVSILAMIICVALLIGSTFAWFTDTEKSEANRIVAGTLDVEMNYKNAKIDEWKSIETASSVDPKFFVDIDGNDILWEPGTMAYAKFQIKNVGNLALKYAFATNVAFNTYNGKDLRDVIKVAIFADEIETPTRASIEAIDTAEWKTFVDFNNSDFLKAGEKDEFLVVLYWAPTANDNDYNVIDGDKTDDGKDALEIKIDVVLTATQLTYEKDSFDENYDGSAAWLGQIDEAGLTAATDIDNKIVKIYTPEVLAAFAKNAKNYLGYTISVENDLDLGGVNWTPINLWDPENRDKTLVFDGNGKTISNLKIDAKGDNVGFFGQNTIKLTINDLTFENADVSSEGKFIGTVIGYQYGDVVLNNVDIRNSSIIGKNSLVIDDPKSIRVGGLIGYSLLDDGATLSLADCDVEGSYIEGYHTTCGLVGTLKDFTALTDKWSMTNCSVKNSTIAYGNGVEKNSSFVAVDGVAYPETVENDAYFAGKVTLENNTFKKVTAEDKFEKALANAKPGDTVALRDGVAYEKINIPADLNGVTIKGVEGTTIEVFAFPTDAAIKDLTFDNVTISTTNDLVMAEFGANSTLENVIFSNCTIIGDNGDKYSQAGVKANASNTSYDITFDNCKFVNVARAIYPNQGHCSKLVIKNCEFEGGTAWTITANNNSQGFDEVIIDNCVFDNVMGVAKFTNKAKKVTITNNTFIGNCKEDHNTGKKMFDITPSVSCTISGNMAGETATTLAPIDLTTGNGITMP